MEIAMSCAEIDRPAPADGTEPAIDVAGVRVGRIVGWQPGLGPLVDYPGNPHGPLLARMMAGLDIGWATSPEADQRHVVLVFESQLSNRPLLIGVIDGAVGLREAPVQAGPASRAGSAAGAAVVVDGRRMVIEAQDEVVLKCGEASIVMRRNGRIVIRGNYVETRSRGVNRVRGGSVEIN